jgi:hypothetical protein
VILGPASDFAGGPNVVVQHTVAKAFLPKPGPNQGNKWIPMCTGVHRVDLDGSYSPSPGTVLPCSGLTDATGLGGWVTKGGIYPSPAVCASDGNFWGIMGSFQDSIPPQDPQITGWVGNPDGSRTFIISLGTLQLDQHWYWDSLYRP